MCAGGGEQIHEVPVETKGSWEALVPGAPEPPNMGTETQTHILCKRSICSQALSQLSGPHE